MPLLPRFPRAAVATGLLASLMTMAWSGASVQAQETSKAPASSQVVSLELNKSVDVKGSCGLTFVVSNKTGGAIEKAAYQLVLFDKDGLVDRMTVFNFGALPVGKTVVRQFNLPSTPCTSLSSILVNGPADCDDAATDNLACSSGVETRSRSDIAFTR